eukprot:Amastigsp_a511374_167.p6 type:complete len:106 gc:universal Amastigsp_a511374_167:1591-1908(+)
MSSTTRWLCPLPTAVLWSTSRLTPICTCGSKGSRSLSMTCSSTRTLRRLMSAARSLSSASPPRTIISPTRRLPARSPPSTLSSPRSTRWAQTPCARTRAPFTTLA